ncbi:MAG: hypothetical protein AB7K35_01375 [Pseudorhodoplanes sp.]
MFAQFLHIFPTLIGAALCLFVLYKFWTGLSLKPHREGHRAPPARVPPFCFWERW